jgi:hypothetical protein
MHVAVAIVSYRNPQDVTECLAALAASRHRDFEVVICENGGEAAFAALTALVPRLLPGGRSVRPIAAPSNLGFAGGVNLCMRQTPDADAWWILNPDTCPEPLALAGLVERLEAGDCDAVGGTIQLTNGQVQAYGGRWQTWLARAVSLGYGQNLGEAIDPKQVEGVQNFLNGASMLVGRRFAETVGPMREDYFLYCEEVEWCLRAGRLGMRLGFAPQGVVVHKQGTSTGNAVDLRGRSRLSVYLNERNRLLLSRDCFPGLLPVAALTTLATFVLRFGRLGAWRQLAFAAEGWAAGLANQRGVPVWAKHY